MKQRSFLIIFIFSLWLNQNTFAQDSANIYLTKAQKLYDAEQYVKAMNAYKEAIIKAPKSYAALLGLADSQHKLEMFKQSVEVYDRAEKVNDQDAELYFNRGAALVFMQEFRKAIKDFDQSLELKADQAKVYYYRGYSNSALSRYRNAVDDYSRAIELKPDYAEAYYNRGAAKAELGNYENGLKDFEKALEKKPNLQNGKINLALSKLGMKKYQEAIGGLTEIIEQRDENLARAYFYRGEAKYEIKKKNEACGDWRKAANLGHAQAAENANNFCDKESGKKKRDIDIVF
ncbi:MAG: tetratricopeptide repeat protein [Vicingaceae bacterium]